MTPLLKKFNEYGTKDKAIIHFTIVKLYSFLNNE